MSTFVYNVGCIFKVIPNNLYHLYPKGANPGKLVTVVLLYQEQESLKEEHSIECLRMTSSH